MSRIYILGETRKETVSQGGGASPSVATVGRTVAAGCLGADTVSGATLSKNPGCEQTIKEFVPASWFHPVGIYKVLARIWDRLPDVSGKLFLTFTLDPKALCKRGSGLRGKPKLAT